jgi:hypothetical protein
MAEVESTGGRSKGFWAITAAVIGTVAAVVGILSQIPGIAKFSCQIYSAPDYCKVVTPPTPTPNEADAWKVVAIELVGVLSKAKQNDAAAISAAGVLARSPDKDVRDATAFVLAAPPGGLIDASSALDIAVRAQGNTAEGEAFGKLVYPLEGGDASSPLALLEKAMAPVERSALGVVSMQGAPIPDARIADGGYFRALATAPVGGKALLLERTVNAGVVVLSPRPENSPPGGDRLKAGKPARFPNSDEFAYRAEVAPALAEEKGRFLLLVVPEYMNVEAMRQMIIDPDDVQNPNRATFKGLSDLAGYLESEVTKAPTEWAWASLDYVFVKEN